jgi:uncharacterized membrane protein YgcG
VLSWPASGDRQRERARSIMMPAMLATLPLPGVLLARHLAVALTVLVALLLALAPLTAAQDEDVPFSARGDGIHIVDEARIINGVDEEQLQAVLQAVRADAGIDIVVYTREQVRVGARRDARDDAARLLEEWQVGGEAGTGAVMFWNINPDGTVARNGVALGPAFAALDAEDVDEAVNSAVLPGLRSQDWISALLTGQLELQSRLNAAPAATPAPTPTPRPGSTSTPRRPSVTEGRRPTSGLSPQAGPAFPDPIDGLRVYDYAEVVSPAVIDRIGQTIAAIEERTGAQIVVYTQVKPQADDPGRTEQDAIDLIDQWGVGREGFDDGLAIFFNLREDRCHGQVQLYAGPGFASTYLANTERQTIYEEQMLPALKECDFDAALTAALARIDTAATAEHARDLQLARQVDAATGLIVAPLLLIGLVVWAGWSWLRYGRDPIYLDDASILMPAPPPGLSPAAAALVMDGRPRRHALTTALVDLASRGEISFRASEHDPRQMDIDITVPDQRDARLARNRRLPLGEAEKYALDELKRLGGAIRTIEATDMPRFAKSVGGFEDRLERTVAANGWFREPPSDSVERWSRRAAVVLIAGVAGIFGGLNLPSNGLLLVGVAASVGAVAVFIIARAMPQRTLEGARTFAQLAAYRRTLQKTLEQSRTMDQVVSSGVLPWVETPDQAVVWAYALGLHEEAEEVLERSMEDVRTGAASPTRTYFPLWYGIGERSGARISGGARAPTAGLFSSGVVPDFTSMTAALATIGSPPASSGGGGGGGFGGGGSGGGGGGAGGGF